MLGKVLWWCLVSVLLLWLAPASLAQELEPRRWSHLPIDTNFAADVTAYTEADIAFDPTLLVEGAELEMYTVGVGYVRTFELLDKSARIDILQAYQDATWTGTLDGVAAEVTRTGLTDTVARLAVHLYGAPPLAGEAYAAYRSNAEIETFVGAALAVQLPTGQYKEDKALNLGTNRFTFRPQLGIVHNRGPWTFEGTGMVALYGDNDEFFDGNKREQDPFYTFQGHAIYTLRPGIWAGLGIGYGYGGESTVNGAEKGDRKEGYAWGLSGGYPITRWLGVKASYLGIRTWEAVGADSDTLAIGLSTFW